MVLVCWEVSFILTLLSEDLIPYLHRPNDIGDYADVGDRLFRSMSVDKMSPGFSNVVILSTLCFLSTSLLSTSHIMNITM